MKRLLLTSLSCGSPLCPIPAEHRSTRRPRRPRHPRPIPSQSTNVVQMTERQVQEMRADIPWRGRCTSKRLRIMKLLLAQSPKDAELLNKIGVAYQQVGNASRRALLQARDEGE